MPAEARGWEAPAQGVPGCPAQGSGIASLQSAARGLWKRGLPCFPGCGSEHLAGIPKTPDLDLISAHALSRLSSLRGLRDLALVDCPGVSDIGICYLLKHTTG